MSNIKIFKKTDR